MSAAERIAAAAEEIQYTEDSPETTSEEKVEETVSETGSDETEAEVEAEVEATPEGEAAPEATEPEPEAKVDAQFAALRRNQKKQEAQQVRYQEDYTKRESDLAAREAKLAPIMDAINTNPEEAFNLLAEKSGRSSDDLFRQVAERKIKDGEPGPAEMMDRISRLEAELASRDSRAKQHAQQTKKQRAEQAYANRVDGFVRESENLDPVKFPNLTSLPPEVMRGKVRYGVEWAMVNSPNSTYPEMLKALDEIAGEEYAHQERSKGARVAESPATSPEVTRVPDKPAASSRTISNRTQAQTSSRSNGARALPSRDERLARAAAALEDM
jgi:hypothetical protein